MNKDNRICIYSLILVVNPINHGVVFTDHGVVYKDHAVVCRIDIEYISIQLIILAEQIGYSILLDRDLDNHLPDIPLADTRGVPVFREINGELSGIDFRIGGRFVDIKGDILLLVVWNGLL